MKAWEFRAVGEPLVLVDRPEPVPGEGEVVVEVKAAGMCHSDVGFVDGSLEALAYTPIVLGHEVAGVIAQLGPGVDGFALGDRVGVVSLDFTGPGVGRDGGYEARMIAKVPELVRIPDGTSFAQAAMGTDAGGTSYRAVRSTGGVTAGMKVGIIGLGGLGQIGARVAVLAGADVHAAEPKESVRASSSELGVTQIFEDAKDFVGLGLDVIVDFAGYGTTTATAIEAVRPGGRVVQIGLGRPEATISTQTLVLEQKTLVGSLGATPEDVEAVYALFASGGLDPLITTMSFEDIGEGIDRLSRGEVAGRLVAVYE